MSKRKADVNEKKCVACGACTKVCPRDAITVWKGKYAVINDELCVGCGKCEKICPAGIIDIVERGDGKNDEG